MSGTSNSNGSTGFVIIILAVVVVLVGGGLYLFKFKPEQEAAEKARLEQVAKEAAEKNRLELEAQKKVNYDKLIDNADVQFAQENWESARSQYTDASSIFPNQQYPKDQLALVNAKLEELAKRAAGIVERVSTTTGRFYIVVSSSIDDDLAMDYANKLAKEGNSVKIIEHTTGKLVFYRVSLANYPTREQAESAKASFSSYGDGVWILEY